MAGLLKKAGELGLLGGGVPEEYGGAGLDRSLLHGALRKNLFLRVVQRERRRAFRHRHAAHRLFRHRGAKEKISAEALHRRMAGLLLPLGAAGWFRRAGLPHARGALSRRQAAGCSTARKCGSPTADSPTSTSCSPKSTARNFPASSSSAAFPVSLRGAEEKKMGLRGSSTTPIFFENCRVPKENLLHEIGRGHIVAFNILNVGRFTLGASCLGFSQEGTGIRRALRQGTHRLRPPHRRLRPDPRQARGNGHSHFRARIDDLSHRRPDRPRHEICRRRRRTRPRTP